ncbi:MAG: hypothetical protein RR202_01785 [Bacteroidales bacterium]
MLQHLSKKLFIERIADYTSSDRWDFKVSVPTLIVFHTEIHLYEKGFRDVYDTLVEKFPLLKCYEVLENEDPEIAAAYLIKDFPATMFISTSEKAFVKSGYLTPDEAIADVQKIY